MNFLDLLPLKAARGTVRLPGSKSISNRVLLLAALSEGVTEVRDLLASDDTARMLEALKTLGVKIESLGNNSYRVAGVAGRFPVKEADLFLGNAGTAFRPLTGALAFSGGMYRLSGVPRMHERPIGDLVEALRQVGAHIDYLESSGFPPLLIRPSQPMAKGVVRVRGDVSSQFLTGLLMALPLLRVQVTVEVEGELISKPYIDITLKTMERFGVSVIREGWERFTLPAGAIYRSPGTVYVEGDASSASYFLALGAIGGGPVRVEGVGADSIQGDVRFAEALEQMGARITMGPNWIEACSPENGVLKGVSLDCNHIPDAAMTLATTALFAEGPTRLTNIASWRVKETDRIHAMATELRKLGAEVIEEADAITVIPGGVHQSPPAGIDTYDDHRMAMCFSLAAFRGMIRINDPGCVAKTFPDYFQCLKTVVEPSPVITLDGPSASGKGTVASRVADKLGMNFLDSGALYRLTALAAQRKGVEWSDESGCAAIAQTLKVEFRRQEILLEGQDVSALIRGEEISVGASLVASLPAVREALLFRQRRFADTKGLVADGRDMGSVVFPDAELKVFLTASAEIRAQRRYKQLIEKGMSANLTDLVKDLQERDQRDSSRNVAPLCCPSGGRVLDTSELSIDEAVSRVMEWWSQK